MSDKRNNYQDLQKNQNAGMFDVQADQDFDNVSTVNAEYEEKPQRDYDDKVAAEKKKKRSRTFFATGAIILVCAIAAFIWSFSSSTSVNDSPAAKEAIEHQISDELPVGVVLLSDDEDEQLEAKDYTIVHDSSAGEAKIWVWDYASEDGDFVQVIVNGAPVGDPFMIKNKPVELSVPTTGTIQIKGVKDGGGGITYAVNYEVNGKTYFNIAPEGNCNTYTLQRG